MRTPVPFRAGYGFSAWLTALFLLTMLLAGGTPIRGEQVTYSMENGTVNEAFEALQEGLPQELRDAMDAFDTETNNSEESGQAFSFSLWMDRILTAAGTAADSVFASVLPLFSLILLMAAARALVPAAAGLHSAFTAFSGLFAAVEIFSLTAGLVSAVQNYLTSLCRVMNLFVPVMEAVCLLGGRVTEKAVSSGGMLLLITLIGNFSSFVLAPLVTLLFTLSAVTMTCPEVKLGGLVTALRTCIQRLWGIMGIVFSFLLGIQTVLAKSADSLTARTARFAIGTFVPVAGGFLSEAYSTVQAGLGFVRQTAGAGGIVLILLLLLPGIMPLLFYKITLSLASSAAEMLGVEPLGGLLREIGGIVDFLLGVVLVTGLLFLLAVILFMKTQV